jgi:hypothetical protein
VITASIAERPAWAGRFRALIHGAMTLLRIVVALQPMVAA